MGITYSASKLRTVVVLKLNYKNIEKKQNQVYVE